VNELSPSTTTIKVIVRHGTKCKREHPGLPPDYKDCNCRKSIYIYENGEDHPIAAKTRIWNEAEKIAQAERDKRDPDKQKVKELEARLAAVQAQAEATEAKKTLTIEDATERWLKAQKGVEINTACSHRWVVSRVRAWAKDNNIEGVADVTPDNLNKWREDWSPVAEKPYSRLEPSTQVTFQSYLKGIFRYIVSLGRYLEKSPAEGLKPIKTKGKPVIPLSPSQFEELLAAIPICCAADNGILHGFAAELRALCLLQRWSGLRIGDAVALPRVGLVGNLLNLITQKTGAEIKDRVIPDLVAAELAALSEDRRGFKKEFFFWPKSISNLRSLESIWEQYFGKLNSFLNFKNQLGEPMPFHSHMLRHTFATQHLLQGMKLEAVSKLLTHESIATTERYYAPWVKERLDKMERDSIDCMRRMGMMVTTPANLEPANDVHNVLDTFLKGLAKTGSVSPLQLQGVAEVVNGLLGIGNRAGWIPLPNNSTGGAQTSTRLLLAS
jgi:site-specific recombinase XerD